MAVMFFLVGSVFGLIGALLGFFAFGLSVSAAVMVYLAISLTVGLTLVLLMMRPDSGSLDALEA